MRACTRSTLLAAGVLACALLVMCGAIGVQRVAGAAVELGAEATEPREALRYGHLRRGSAAERRGPDADEKYLSAEQLDTQSFLARRRTEVEVNAQQAHHRSSQEAHSDADANPSPQRPSANTPQHHEQQREGRLTRVDTANRGALVPVRCETFRTSANWVCSTRALIGSPAVEFHLRLDTSQQVGAGALLDDALREWL
jgi:hypothetical protein